MAPSDWLFDRNSDLTIPKRPVHALHWLLLRAVADHNRVCNSIVDSASVGVNEILQEAKSQFQVNTALHAKPGRNGSKT